MDIKRTRRSMEKKGTRLDVKSGLWRENRRAENGGENPDRGICGRRGKENPQGGFVAK